jgi:hypothetical protein
LYRSTTPSESRTDGLQLQKNEDSKQLLTTHKSNKCSVYLLKFISLPTGLVKAGNIFYKSSFGFFMIFLYFSITPVPLTSACSTCQREKV